jgi:membrane associated rhomboid family serine protease
MEIYKLISGANIVFIITIGISLYGLYVDQSLVRKLSLHPFSFVKGKGIFNLISSGFVHANLQHLGLNMITFYFFAFRLERITGTVNWLIIYFIGLILSDISTLIKNKNNPNYYSLGASGAISALLFSYILFDPFSKIIIFPIPFGIPSYIFALGYLLYSAYAAKTDRGNVNHEAHFYGALSGILTTVILFPNVFRFFVERFIK